MGTECELLDLAGMNKEIQIIASVCETTFTTTGAAGPMEFSSLFEAARHARASSECKNGFVVIRDQREKTTNRIPFNIAP